MITFGKAHQALPQKVFGLKKRIYFSFSDRKTVKKLLKNGKQ
jgi:hypothetical protein